MSGLYIDIAGVGIESSFWPAWRASKGLRGANVHVRAEIGDSHRAKSSGVRNLCWLFALEFKSLCLLCAFSKRLSTRKPSWVMYKGLDLLLYFKHCFFHQIVQFIRLCCFRQNFREILARTRLPTWTAVKFSSGSDQLWYFEFKMVKSMFC